MLVSAGLALVAACTTARRRFLLRPIRTAYRPRRAS